LKAVRKKQDWLPESDNTRSFIIGEDMPASPDLFTNLSLQTIRVPNRLLMPAAARITTARLKWLRKRVHQVKLIDLAKESGMSFLELSRIERKETEVSSEVLERLANTVIKIG
jgi:hypothetical protein